MLATRTTGVFPSARTLTALGLWAASVCAVAAEPDPIQLLRDSAAAAVAPESASVDFVVTTKLVRNDETNDMSAKFTYRTAPGGRFSFDSVAPEGGGPVVGYRVAGNGKVTLTALLGAKRHMLEQGTDGFAEFVRSPAAMGIGSGLGGLALAFLHPAAMNELIDSVKESEFVGQEEVDGEPLLHARYSVEGGVTCDVWYRAEGTPVVRRVKPDVLQTDGVREMASRYETFDYQLGFEFANWDLEAAIPAEDLRVAEPKGSILMASLYERPAGEPYALLGKEAPAMTLPSAAGEEIDLAKSFGTDVVLLEFWATNCPYCIQAMPELEKLEKKYAERGLKYFAVNVGEAADDVAAFLKDQGLTPTALIDAEAEMARAYEVGPIPLILLVGRDGKVQSANEGYSPAVAKRLVQNIEAALEGEDLASAALDRWREANAKRTAERDRLKSLLDG